MKWLMLIILCRVSSQTFSNLPIDKPLASPGPWTLLTQYNAVLVIDLNGKLNPAEMEENVSELYPALTMAAISTNLHSAQLFANPFEMIVIVARELKEVRNTTIQFKPISKEDTEKPLKFILKSFSFNSVDFCRILFGSCQFR